MIQKMLADYVGCGVKVINRIVNGRTSVTAERVLKLGATFRTTPDLLNAQRRRSPPRRPRPFEACPDLFAKRAAPSLVTPRKDHADRRALTWLRREFQSGVEELAETLDD